MRNWKTTAAGIVGALAILTPVLQHWAASGFDWMTLMGLLASGSVGALGYQAQDAPPTPKAPE